ncbi:hypothetical protein [Mycobacterium uberis]|uniref:hypothetical protein n=1 Tax=Mycobacterium uberis TaxID=2162698 RepID=UPI000E307260|nr:hypothetical protein [Mycobacterium uberis]
MLWCEFDTASVKRATATSGVSLMVSSVQDTEAENDLPELDGRCAAGSVLTTAAASTMATLVMWTCGMPFAGGAAWAAQYLLVHDPRCGVHLHHSQLIFAERSGLVETDGVDTAERLH